MTPEPSAPVEEQPPSPSVPTRPGPWPTSTPSATWVDRPAAEADLPAIHARIDAAWSARLAERAAAGEAGPTAQAGPTPVGSSPHPRRRRAAGADTTMWLSHHWPGDYDRCAVVAGRHVCRRCLFMYPVALVAAMLAGVGLWWPSGFDAWALWLLPAAAVADFVIDNLHLAPYRPGRQAVLSAIGALAAGAGYHRYLQHPGDPTVWSVVATYCAVCGLAAYVRSRRVSI